MNYIHITVNETTEAFSFFFLIFVATAKVKTLYSINQKRGIK